MDDALVRDPYGGYGRLRERAPLVLGERTPTGPVWMATRYAEVKALYADPRLVANRMNVPGSPAPERGAEDPHRMGRQDGAPHRRLRRLVAPAFAPDKMSRLRPRIERLAAELTDELSRTAVHGTADLLRSYALELPNVVLCELTGHLVSEFVLAGAEGDVGGLTDTEIVTIMLMEHDAYRSVAHVIANGMVALLTHPGQAEVLRERPELMPGAVHELLRFCGPATVGRMRHATQHVEVGGVRVRKGEAVRPLIAAANRDPRAFDRPDTLDVTRDARRHLAFGGGPHHCVGPSLTLITAEAAFGALLRRFPRMSLGVPRAELRYEPNPRQWGLVELPVRLSHTSRPHARAGTRRRTDRRSA